MDLRPLKYRKEVSATQFDQLFSARLGRLYGRALAVLHALGPMHSYAVANCIHLGLQKGVVDNTFIGRLERWSDVARNTQEKRRRDPSNAAEFDAETRLFFKYLHAEYFIAGQSQLIVPASVSSAFGYPLASECK